MTAFPLAILALPMISRVSAWGITLSAIDATSLSGYPPDVYDKSTSVPTWGITLSAIDAMSLSGYPPDVYDKPTSVPTSTKVTTYSTTQVTTKSNSSTYISTTTLSSQIPQDTGLPTTAEVEAARLITFALSSVAAAQLYAEIGRVTVRCIDTQPNTCSDYDTRHLLVELEEMNPCSTIDTVDVGFSEREKYVVKLVCQWLDGDAKWCVDIGPPRCSGPHVRHVLREFRDFLGLADG